MHNDTTTTYRRPASEAARQHANEYQRRYRREHPERVKGWRDAYILRRAARLMEQQQGGESDGGH